MGTGAVSDREAITAVLDRFEAAQTELASLSFDSLTAPEVLAVKDRLETVARRQGAATTTHSKRDAKYGINEARGQKGMCAGRGIVRPAPSSERN